MGLGADAHRAPCCLDRSTAPRRERLAHTVRYRRFALTSARPENIIRFEVTNDLIEADGQPGPIQRLDDTPDMCAHMISEVFWRHDLVDAHNISWMLDRRSYECEFGIEITLRTALCLLRRASGH